MRPALARPAHQVAVLIALGAALYAPRAEATVARYLDLPTLVDYSHVIVRAEVVGQKTYVDLGKTGRVVTDTTLRVTHAYWGAKAAQRIVVQQFGGTLNGVTHKIPGDPSFTRGDDVVLFLKRDVGGTLHFLTAMAQARYQVIRSKTGQETVVRDLHGLAFMGAKPGAFRHVKTSPQALPSFHAELEALIGGIKGATQGGAVTGKTTNKTTNKTGTR